VGLAYGVSTLSIIAALESPPERYDIIDAFQTRDWHGAGLRHLQEAGIPGGLVFHEELSELCLPRLLAAGARYDFAYIDGWHTFDQVAVEFYFINRMLAPGGVIVFDDVHMPSLQKALAQVLSFPAYERLPLPDDFRRSRVARVRRAAGVPEYRLAAVRKRAEDRRDWDWFEDF
jgi:predicted O-methyltransferase YrrM